MKDWKAMFGKRMAAAAMLFLLLTAAAGSRAEAGWVSQTLERLENEGWPRLDVDDPAAAIKKQRVVLEQAKADYMDAFGAEPDFNYENDINLVVMYNSADEIVYIGPAILKYDGGVAVAITAAFDEEVASAVVGGTYELDISTVRDAGMTGVMCDVKDLLPENEGAFLNMDYAHPPEDATLVYYDEEFDFYADAITLTVYDDGGIDVGLLPENMQYPAALVNADNALIGTVGKYAADGDIYITTYRDPSEEGKAAAGDATGGMAGDAPEGAPENWDYDLKFVVVNDSEGNPLHVGTAVALRTDPATVFSKAFDEGFVSAYLTTDVRAYYLNTDSMVNFGNGLSYWTAKDPLPDDDPSFLDSGYAHQNENATIVYYAKKNGEIVPCAESVTLTECSETGRLTADHYPEDMTIYPAVLVNADNKCLGIIQDGGIIAGGTDQETFYGDTPAASEGATEGAQEDTAGSTGETSAEKPAVSVEPEEAVHPAVMQVDDFRKMLNTSAVQLDGNTYVLTSIDMIEGFDYQTQSISILPEDLPENRGLQVRVLPMILTREGMIYRASEYENSGNDLPVVALYGVMQQDNAIGGLPVADAINPEHQLGYVFSYVSLDDPESKDLYDHVWQDYILQYSPLRDNLYLIEDEIEYQDNLLGGWPGALIYDVVTHEAVGIGTYVDGKYAFEDITTILRDYLDVYAPLAKSICPVDSWGSLLDQQTEKTIIDKEAGE